MKDQEEEIESTENDGEAFENASHHRRHHRHRIRVKQKIKVKKTNSRVKKKAKKWFTYIVWTVLIILFIISIVLLITELDKIGVTKDRRNKKSEIILKETPKFCLNSPAIKNNIE